VHDAAGGREADDLWQASGWPAFFPKRAGRASAKAGSPAAACIDKRGGHP